MEINANDMMPVPIEDLVNGVKTPCDLFIRLTDDKFILICKEGATTQVEQLKNYKDKEVPYLWVFKKEYYKMVHQTTSIAGVLMNRKEVGVAKKTEILSKAASTSFAQIATMGMDLNTYATARQVSEAIFSLSEHHKGLSELMESLKKCSDYLIGHSIAVSLMSTILGQEMGYEKKATLEKLALGGMLHDIGLKSMPTDLLKKSQAQMSPEELHIWETHPFRGMQMLQSIGIVPDDVIAMVYEHHENSIGQGFPQRMRDVKMHPLAKIIALADLFCELTMPGPNMPNPKNAREAVMYIEATMGLPYNKEVFRALKRMIDTGRMKTAA